MKTRKFINCAFFAVITMTILSFELPSGWIRLGTKPDSYNMGIDNGTGRDGKNTATIKSIKKKIKGFGTLMQICLPDSYLGKRVRLSGWVKTKDVAQWSALWFRVDEKGGKGPSAFDNMKAGKTDRSITGTTEWKQYTIVLDVSKTASKLAYGALLYGTGQIWFDDITFEIVDSTVPTTGAEEEMEEVNVPNKEPVNLSFEN